MDITTTLVKLKEYFQKWHSENFNELHPGFNDDMRNSIINLANLISRKMKGDSGSQISKLDDLNQIITESGEVTNLKDIETRIHKIEGVEIDSYSLNPNDLKLYDEGVYKISADAMKRYYEYSPVSNWGTPPACILIVTNITSDIKQQIFIMPKNKYEPVPGIPITNGIWIRYMYNTQEDEWLSPIEEWTEWERITTESQLEATKQELINNMGNWEKHDFNNLTIWFNPYTKEVEARFAETVEIKNNVDVASGSRHLVCTIPEQYWPQYNLRTFALKESNAAIAYLNASDGKVRIRDEIGHNTTFAGVFKYKIKQQE